MLEQAMISVRNQTHRPLEHVIVDDGSFDDTAQRVEGFDSGDINVRLIRIGTNKGAGNAAHVGFSEANGDYVSFLAADDMIVDPQKTEKQVRTMKRKDSDWSYYRNFYSGLSVSSMTLKRPSYLSPLYPLNRFFENNPHRRLTALMFRNPINFSSVMIRKECVKRYGQIDPVTRNVDGDADLLLRYTALELKLTVLNGAPIFYRDHPKQTSKNRPLMIRGSEIVRLRLLRTLDETDKLLEHIKKSTPFLIAFLSTHRFLVYPSTDKYLCDFILRNRNSMSWVLLRAAARARRKVEKRISDSGLYQQELESNVRDAMATDIIKNFRTILQTTRVGD
jgi:glycosyltransferase involved in cell wall biosynthesis